jgi:4-amino-4-deoxy-L-arabinose transferase-like glycosyltransferase
MRTYAPLAAILGLFAIFTWLFVSATPYRTSGVVIFQGRAPAPDIGAPDERQHANYIRDVMAGKGIPVLRIDDPELYENYQAHQPPVYYFVAAAWGKLTGADPESEAGGRSLRLLSLLMGLGTLTGAYFLSLWGTGRKAIALGAASFGLMPMFVCLHSAVSNDPLLFLLCTWALALIVKSVVHGWKTKTSLIIGVLIGVGILTKTSAIGLLPILLVAGLISLKSSSPSARGRLLLPALAAGLLPLLLAAPWWIRNSQLYGDPLAMSVFNSAFKGSPQASEFIREVGPKVYWLDMVTWWTTRSFVGVFGYMDIFMFEDLADRGRVLAKSNSIYLAVQFLTALAFAAGATFLFKKRPSDIEEDLPNTRPVLILAGVAIFVYIVLLIQFNRQYFQGQARYIYPAFGAFALLAGSGMEMLRPRLKSYSWIPLAAFLCILDLVAWQQLGPAFALRTTGL